MADLAILLWFTSWKMYNCKYCLINTGNTKLILAMIHCQPHWRYGFQRYVRMCVFVCVCTHSILVGFIAHTQKLWKQVDSNQPAPHVWMRAHYWHPFISTCSQWPWWDQVFLMIFIEWQCQHKHYFTLSICEAVHSASLQGKRSWQKASFQVGMDLKKGQKQGRDE